MDKKKGIFLVAVIIDIALAYLAHLVFYEKLFDDDISILLTWIIITGATFMTIITIGLAIAIPRKKRIKIRKRRSKKEVPPEEIAEFTPILEKTLDDDSEKEKVEEYDLERVTSKSGIVKIRRVTKEDLDEIEEHVHEDNGNFRSEIQKVIDERTREKVDTLVANKQSSKMEKSEKLVSQNEIAKSTVEQKARKKAITNEDKTYNYLEDHPDATTSEVRKAVGCKQSSAKRYRSLWLKNEGN